MITTPRCLIVDDEPDISELLSLTIERMGIKTECADTVEDAKFRLSRSHYDLCLTDMRLPDGNGLDLMKHINLHHSGLPIVVMTAFGSADNAVSALKAGAVDYLSKPISIQQLRPIVASAIKPQTFTINKDAQPSLIGNSDAIKKVRELIYVISQSDKPAMITGEAGTGKELAARLIHFNSQRRHHDFIKVNCTNITEKNAAIQLFGQEKSRENSGKNKKPSYFEAANQGTLFFAHVDKLPLMAQCLLEQAIEENKENIRVICSTQKDLKNEVEQGYFNSNLYYQLNVLSLHMPSLRSMYENIPALAQHLLAKISWPTEATPTLSACALSKLNACTYDGNVGELKNILDRAYSLYRPEVIKAEHLVISEKNILQPEISTEASEMPLPDYLDYIERQTILKALKKVNHNKTAAAKLLGVSFRTLRYRLSKLGLAKITR